MRLSMTKSPNATSYYVIKDYTDGKKRTSKIVEKLGTEKELRERLNGEDPMEWAKVYIARLNEKEKQNKVTVIARYDNSKLIPMEQQRLFNGGYLFLQDIYYSLKLDKTCRKISAKYKFDFNLNAILSRLLYTRIISPSSKLSSFESSRRFLEQTEFDLHQVYRALEVIARETELIEAEVYQNSLSLVKRNSKVLYYDCTNFFFEIEQAEGIKQYGLSKEHRPNPIVQMGLFMDGDGLPLAFCIHKGNENEQTTLKPLEQRIMDDFHLSKFIVCTDAGLASAGNRSFNDEGDRAYVVTQPLKKLKGPIREWALSREGWYLPGQKPAIHLDTIDESSANQAVYYKSQWIVENGMKQKLIVTYSPAHKAYQEHIRDGQVQRAVSKIEKPSSIHKKKPNDPQRFIQALHCTLEGEVAPKTLYSLNLGAIREEQRYDGYYAVYTNLQAKPEEIIAINKQRWQIEATFRVLKSEFKARPVYLSRDDRIQAHFTTCFLSLLLFRILEKKLGDKYSSTQIIDALREMNFLERKGDGYIPTYTRTGLTDDLHERFGFRTDTEIVDTQTMKKIQKLTRK